MGFQKGNKLWMKKKNFKHTEETKIKISESKSGIPINHDKQFKKGMIPWNKNTYGLVKPNSGSFKKGQKSLFNGRKHLENTKIQISNKKTGKPSWNKNKNLSEQHRIKLSMAKTKEKEFTGFKQIINRRIRMMGKYLEWRSAVFKRDNYHCQNCGENGYIEAHHIIPFSKIIKTFNVKTSEQARKCKELWDVGNGITYCKICHNLTKNGRELKSQTQF